MRCYIQQTNAMAEGERKVGFVSLYSYIRVGGVEKEWKDEVSS